MAETGENLVLFPHENAFGDNFTEGGAGGRDLDFLDDHAAAGIEDEHLPEPADARLVIANRLQPAGGGIDLGLEEIVADRVGLRIAEPQLIRHHRRSGRSFTRQPGEAERGDFDDRVLRAVFELARFHDASDRQRVCAASSSRTARAKPHGLRIM